MSRFVFLVINWIRLRISASGDCWLRSTVRVTLKGASPNLCTPNTALNGLDLLGQESDPHSTSARELCSGKACGHKLCEKCIQRFNRVAWAILALGSCESHVRYLCFAVVRKTTPHGVGLSESLMWNSYPLTAGHLWDLISSGLWCSFYCGYRMAPSRSPRATALRNEDVSVWKHTEINATHSNSTTEFASL